MKKDVPEMVWGHGGDRRAVCVQSVIDEHTERMAMAEGMAMESL